MASRKIYVHCSIGKTTVIFNNQLLEVDVGYYEGRIWYLVINDEEFRISLDIYNNKYVFTGHPQVGPNKYQRAIKYQSVLDEIARATFICKRSDVC